MAKVISEPEPVEVLKYPYPYQAAFTVASDIDSASIARFRAIHALFCGSDLLKEDSPEWQTLGLTTNCPLFDKDHGGIRGLGLDFADSFFLISDPTTLGMYRYVPRDGSFVDDEQAGTNCAEFVRQRIREGQIDTFHTFLHYTRRQVEPLLNDFYSWCESEGVAKPTVWINHSGAVTPSGLCPEALQPNRVNRLARMIARNVVGPLLGRSRYPLRFAFARYEGDTPGSQHYVNDLLAANGLRYVWLGTEDLHRNKMALPEYLQNERSTILRPVTMDDGVRYWRFDRCYGWFRGGPDAEAYLRESREGYDASYFITEKNLDELCRCGGTCILYTHWTHYRSMPIPNETIARFELLRRWRDEGKIWVTSTSRLLEWTRRRTFLRYHCSREGKRMIVAINGVDDPIVGRETLDLKALHGFTFRLRSSEAEVTVTVNGNALSPEQVHRVGSLFWLDAGAGSKHWPDLVAAAAALCRAPRLFADPGVSA